ncbi:hypothetical protein Sango_2810200 [Sesamum angolense]|uniref:DUF4283 domain-containing protein n=1 Tax=Sesamum angolense TaxID=2727404 RepID=A0AAE1T7T8_9LAMI|nr:hypothetical protein Sango_2810200 [Sesamum angolense]
MAKGKRSKTQAATTGNSSKVAAAAGRHCRSTTADTATAATAAADVRDNTKAISFQAFISDLEASPSFHLSHASADNALGRQEKEEEHCFRNFTLRTAPLRSSPTTDVRAKLGFCIVGYIAGKFPGMQAIRALSKTWGASFQQHYSGWLVFRFARDDDRQRILAGGPYFIYGRPLLLKPMPDCFEFKEDDISLTPVWATPPSLPLECWHQCTREDRLSLGTPIAMDSLTMRMEQHSPAKRSSRSGLLGLLMRAELPDVNATPNAGDYGLPKSENAAWRGVPPPITMRIGFWNVRGFNRPLKHNGVAHLIKNNRLCLLGILETKLTTSAIARINRTFPGCAKPTISMLLPVDAS